MTELILAKSLVIVLVSAFIGGVIAKKLHFPLLVGYLLSGMFIGAFLKSYIDIKEAIKSIAEIGVVLLLFTLGLEFTLAKMKEFGEVIIFGSLVQVLLTIFISVIVFPIIGIDFYSALFLGTVFSLSSTAVALKTLSDKGELETLHGELTSGWLFMQDLYTLPLIIILPTVGLMMKGETVGIGNLFIFLKSLSFAFFSFFVVIYLGKTIVPKVIERIADLRSRELVLVASVSFCLLSAFLFQVLGLSYALGAFIAGILLSNSSAHHGIFAEVRPLKDLFSTVFFVSLGFILNVQFLASNWFTIFVLVILVILIKFTISVLLVFLLGYHTKTATLVGFSLISVGEFAFILALIGISASLITAETYMIILSVSFISLIISVPLLSKSENIYYKMKQFIGKIPKLRSLLTRLDRTLLPLENSLSDHIVVLGHGRVGKYICKALAYSKIPYIVVDYNHKLVKLLRNQDVNVIYGDPAEIDVLEFARVREAKAAILAYSDRHTQETVVLNILSLNPKIKIICRTHFDEDHKKLKSLGVDSIVQPEFEAAVSMTERLLRFLYLNSKDIEEKLRNLRNHQGLG